MSALATVASDVEKAALTTLSALPNPFHFTVVTAGTEPECSAFDVPEFLESQLGDLRFIIRQYREGRPLARVYPILGDVGSGKTHLHTKLVTELERDAIEASSESIVINVNHFPPNLNGVDHLYNLLVSHVLGVGGSGERTLRAIAARLLAKLLVEALRQLPPNEQVGLIPSSGLVESLQLRLGSSTVSQRRLDQIGTLIRACDVSRPTSESILNAIQHVGIATATILKVIVDHLDESEPNDALGTTRRELYTRICRIVLENDRDPFEELHLEEIESLPSFLKDSPSATSNEKQRTINRWLLTAWLELIDSLQIPLILVMDQIEEPVLNPSQETSKGAISAFLQFLASIVNNVPDVCIFVFAEEKTWFGAYMQQVDKYIVDRIAQPFDLPGRPGRRQIAMPDRIPREVLTRIIRKRIQTTAPTLDLTGLSPTFPFSSTDLDARSDDTTLRQSLLKLGERYAKIVYPQVIDQSDLEAIRKRFKEGWKTAVSRTKKELGSDSIYTAAKIPEVQTMLDSWLQLLLAEGLTGDSVWYGVEMQHVEFRRQYGYLNVIRTEGADLPGVGIAAWLAGGKTKAHDLERRIEFFSDNPCPIKTLIALREDGEKALTASSKTIFDKAIHDQLDLRIVPFEPKHVHSLFALDKWRQVIQPDLQQYGDAARGIYREVLAEIAQQLLTWINEWRKPRVGK